MDHNSSTVQERTSFSSLGDRLPELKSSGLVGEYLKLETCNRFELYLVLSSPGDERGAVASFDVPGARMLYDYEAVRHLLRVLLGLESMARGESHIVSQVKEAYRASDGCGKVLHKLFQRASGMSASLRSRIHPGREPSVPYIAANYFVKNFRSGARPSAMVAGLGAMGTETAHILLLMGCDVRVSNRSPREMDKKISAAALVPWSGWLAAARECDALFLCTSSSSPILTGEDEDSMPDVAVYDLGSPHQSAGRNVGIRVTLDEMNDMASAMNAEYAHMLLELEDEADKTSSALLAEISILTDDTWKQLAMTRVHSLIKDRAVAYAAKTGAGPDDLEAFASSVVSAFLHPLTSAHTAHSSRAWRILSGENEEYAED
jgi:glutamyl-tRNA reductase